MLKLIKGTSRKKPDEPGQIMSKEATAPEGALNVELSRPLGQLLAPYLGPVANHLVRSTAASCSTLDELAQALALHIPDAKERSAFVHAVATSGLSSLPFHEDQSSVDPGAPEEGKAGAGTEANETDEERFTPEQLEKLTQALAYYVGPLASRLVNANKVKVNSMEALNLAVAKSISDPDDWAAFLMTRRNDP